MSIDLVVSSFAHFFVTGALLFRCVLVLFFVFVSFIVGDGFQGLVDVGRRDSRRERGRPSMEALHVLSLHRVRQKESPSPAWYMRRSSWQGGGRGQRERDTARLVCIYIATVLSVASIAGGCIENFYFLGGDPACTVCRFNVRHARGVCGVVDV